MNPSIKLLDLLDFWHNGDNFLSFIHNSDDKRGKEISSTHYRYVQADEGNPKNASDIWSIRKTKHFTGKLKWVQTVQK